MSLLKSLVPAPGTLHALFSTLCPGPQVLPPACRGGHPMVVLALCQLLGFCPAALSTGAACVLHLGAAGRSTSWLPLKCASHGIWAPLLNSFSPTGLPTNVPFTLECKVLWVFQVTLHYHKTQGAGITPGPQNTSRGPKAPASLCPSSPHNQGHGSRIWKGLYLAPRGNIFILPLSLSPAQSE